MKILFYLLISILLIIYSCSNDNPITGGTGSNDSLLFSCDSLSDWGHPNVIDTSVTIKNKSIHKIKATMDLLTLDSLNQYAAGYHANTFVHWFHITNSYSFIDSGFYTPDSINIGLGISNTYNTSIHNVKIFKLN